MIRIRSLRAAGIALAATAVLSTTPLTAGASAATGSSTASTTVSSRSAQARPAAVWPTAKRVEKVSTTKPVSGNKNFDFTRFVGTGALGGSGQVEGQDPILELADGATVSNVIIGSPAADGIHCRGTCTLKNVWWEDVGEDAATFKGTRANQTMTVDGGGARKAADKVFQHNGPGTFVIRNFEVSDFGKLYRSCGVCRTQYTRHVVVDNVTVKAPGLDVVGINATPYGDTARLSRITVVGDSARKIVVCQKFRGTTSGEPTKTGSGPDGRNCIYKSTDVTYR
ncbi:pectate lyase [Streptomyces sp. NBC_00285]|uniref:pectate lyase n=1 Tax=Streptomyces sp. NBC_00285 TaxID=2975700 RepID=UPI002E2AD6AC|nr:pectate lyase [Streptomyces sp. NBC_00285]